VLNFYYQIVKNNAEFWTCNFTKRL